MILNSNFRVFALDQIARYMGVCLLFTCLTACHSSKKVAQKTPPTPDKTPTIVEPIKPTPVSNNIGSFEDKTTIAKTQLLLNLFGYDPGKADSTLKDQTVAALRVFQTSNQIEAGDRSTKSLETLGLQWFDFSLDSLQMALSKKGYDPGPIDGLLGPMTRGAWKDFLKQNNFSSTHLTKESRDAVFALTYQYDKPTENLLKYDTSTPLDNGAFYATKVSIENVTIRDIRYALNAQGYDTGEMSDAVTPPLEDALFQFQFDKKLPIGEFNTETLKALGFR
ncbi:MAG: hypothetical protein JNM36_01390 [Chitinophagales bacterium]|nr:hypothetical protein [Chitinophagales bacterium]